MDPSLLNKAIYTPVLKMLLPRSPQYSRDAHDAFPGDNASIMYWRDLQT